jgi:hypothetical protein
VCHHIGRLDLCWHKKQWGWHAVVPIKHFRLSQPCAPLQFSCSCAVCWMITGI